MSINYSGAADHDWPGKGDWNRQRNMSKYAENKAKVKFGHCDTCGKTGYIHDEELKTDLPCPDCKSNILDVKRKGGKVRFTYN